MNVELKVFSTVGTCEAAINGIQQVMAFLSQADSSVEGHFEVWLNNVRVFDEFPKSTLGARMLIGKTLRNEISSLYDYNTNDYVREATEAEIAKSIDAENGVIMIEDRQTVYLAE